MLSPADVVVIGGGVHGASAAYHLAREKLQVVLVEKNAIGAGASGQSGGIIRCHYSNEVMVRLAHRAARRWPELEAELGAPVGYVPNGAVVAAAPEDADTMRALVEMQQRIGVAVEPVDPGEVRRWIPEFQADGVGLAAYEAQAGYADPYAAATAFARKARELGAEVLTGVTVTGIELDGATVRGVRTDRGLIRTPLVVNCAGAWAPRIAMMVGVRLPVRPALLQMVAVNPRYPGWTRTSPTWLDLTTMTYCRPDAAGNMLAGGGLSENADMEAHEPDPDGHPPRPSDRFEAEIYENLVRRCPWAEGARRVRSWSGVDGSSPDFHLIFGRAPALRGYLQVAGGSGNSFKLSPATGEAVAEYARTGKCTYLDPEAFGVGRFSAGRPFRGRYRMHIIG